MSQKYHTRGNQSQGSTDNEYSELSDFSEVDSDVLNESALDSYSPHKDSILFINKTTYHPDSTDTDSISARLSNLEVEAGFNESGDGSEDESASSDREQTPTPYTSPSPKKSAPNMSFDQMKAFFDSEEGRQLYQQWAASSTTTNATSNSITGSTITDEQSVGLTSQHRNNITKIENLIDLNTQDINDSPKDFGLKLLSLSVACAFGGRKGFERYRKILTTMNFDTMFQRLRGCMNPDGSLNVAVCCYLGHVILYYWDDPAVKRSLINKYGRGLKRVVGGMPNICKEIGAKNLWIEERGRVSSKKKRDIIDEIALKRFNFDEEGMKAVMEKLGIDV